MRIGFDLDEVLEEYLQALVLYHNDTYNTNFRTNQFRSYNFWETFGGTKEEAIDKVYDFHKTDYFRNVLPVEGAQEAVNYLKEDNELFIITARLDETEEITRTSIEKYFPDSFSEIYFTSQYSKFKSYKSKKRYCEELEINLLIEDSQHNALECLTEDRKVILINRPWNSLAELPKEIYRVNNWKEVLELIK